MATNSEKASVAHLAIECHTLLESAGASLKARRAPCSNLLQRMGSKIERDSPSRAQQHARAAVAHQALYGGTKS